MRATTSIYKVKSIIALVYKSASIWSSVLAILSKGTKIEVISITNGWAYFIYNGKNAYIKTSNISIVAAPIIKGSVTIKYIDVDSNISILNAVVYENLDLKSYTYSSQNINGYKLYNDSSQTITLTQDNPNQTITFLYKKILGSITVKYIDSNTNLEISSPDVYSNLALGSYSYTAKEFDNYNLSSTNTQSITLTQDNTNQVISFSYKKILGSTTINYINTETKENIISSETYSNLELGTYTYDAKSITNYTLISDLSKSITLTKKAPNININFEYKLNEVVKPLEPLDPSKQNEVPYISTYYIKPIVKPDEEVIIDYYITDYYHKEYVSEDFSEVFKVTVRIEGKDDIVIKNLKAGDHSVSLGTFPNLDGQEQKFSILCTDKYGRNSHELFNFFLVRNEVAIKEYIMLKEDLKTYNISNTNDITMITNTRGGLQKLLDDKKALGYNKLKLLAGTYRIDHLYPIYIPTKFTLDMNGATLKLHEFTGDKALMIELNNTFDSHVINGTIEGDMLNHDYTNSPNNSEWVHGISIGGESKYSSYENLTIKDITGYGTINGIKNSRDNKLGYTYLSPKGIGNTFKLGDIDRNTGLSIESTNRTTCDFMDISGYSNIGYLSVSVYLGYQGNPCGTWNLICHFYDENKNFIKSTDAYQYRRVRVPSNSKFMRVTILNEAYPTNLSIQLFRLPTHCTFKDLYLENCRAVGMAPQGMNNLLFENCELTNCGSAVTKCALDAEDGWDMMQDVTFKKLNFHDNPYNEFLTCAGHNFIIDSQFIANIDIKERTKDLVIRNSNCNNVNIGYNESIVRHGIYRIYNNNIVYGNINKNIGKNLNITKSIGGIIYNSTMSSLYNDSTYINCIINVSNSFLGYINKVKLTNCTFKPTDDFIDNYKISFNGCHADDCIFNECIFYGHTVLSNHFYFYSAKFRNCTFYDVLIEPNIAAEETDEIIFTNCVISSSNAYLIKYSPYSYTKGNYTKVTFDNCNITNIINGSLFVYGEAKPSKGFLKLNNCILNLPNLNIFFDCYPSYLENIEDFNILLINTNLNTSISVLSDKLKNNSNINITIS